MDNKHPKTNRKKQARLSCTVVNCKSTNWFPERSAVRCCQHVSKRLRYRRPTAGGLPVRRKPQPNTTSEPVQLNAASVCKLGLHRLRRLRRAGNCIGQSNFFIIHLSSVLCCSFFFCRGENKNKLRGELNSHGHLHPLWTDLPSNVQDSWSNSFLGPNMACQLPWQCSVVTVVLDHPEKQH